MNDPYSLTVFGRLLTCRTCGHHIDVIELPDPWIDESFYQCGTCLRPRILDQVETARDRILNGTYNPATEPIPF